MNATIDNHVSRTCHDTEPSDISNDRPVIERQETWRETPSVNGNGQQKCFVCHRKIADDGWFCKVPREAKRTVLCCPQCALRCFDTPHPVTNGDQEACRAREQRLHFLMAEEKP